MKKNLNIVVILMLFSITLIISYVLIDKIVTLKQIEKSTLDIAESKAQEREAYLQNFFNHAENTLIALSESAFLQHYLKNSDSSGLEDMMLAFVVSHQDIFQFRFIDSDGMEQIRVERAREDSLPSLLPKEMLQDKSNRNYFTNPKNREDSIWFSDLDLNIEHGVVDIPFKPTVRAILPIHYEGAFRGIIIINYLMQGVLKEFIESALFKLVLVDDAGHTLQHYEEAKSWSRYRSEDSYDINEEFPDIKEVLNFESYQADSFFAKGLQIPTNNHLTLLMKVKPSYLKEQLDIANQRILIASITTLILVFLIGLIFHSKINKIISRLAHVERLHGELKVENARQEALLLQQSKMAEMGALLGAIIHQWRQPLSAISLKVQSIDMDNKLNDTPSAELEEGLRRIDKYLQFMFQTMNDFKRFFDPKSEIKAFQPCEVPEKIRSMFAGVFEKKNIHIKIAEHEHFSVMGSESEFMQVLLNIFNNAKDAMEERGQKEGHITCLFELHDDIGVIRIQDDAGGIPEKLLPDKLFDSHITTKGEKGTGIGLNICRIIIEQKMRGTIRAENIDHGAEFIIELPLVENNINKS